MPHLSLVSTTPSAQPIDALSWGVVELQVTDLRRAVTFWTASLGLIERTHPTSGVALGTQQKTLFVLHAGATKPVVPEYTGMYHVAIGVSTQSEFSRMLARLMQLKVRVVTSDHLMAKSLYVHDPDGLEIEICLETPERYGHFGDMSDGLILYDVDGKPHSGRGPLDIAAELGYAQHADLMAPLADDSYLAHLHFKVPALEPALDWFEALGFKRHLTLGRWGFADMGAGAPNTHRLAMNIWAGPNRPPAPDDMARLIRYELIAHDRGLLTRAPLLPCEKDMLQGRDPAGVDMTLGLF